VTNFLEVNIAYRWVLNVSFQEKVPDHSTFSQNYRRKFRDNQVTIKVFMYMIEVLRDNGVIDLTTVYADGTHLNIAQLIEKAIKNTNQIETNVKSVE